MGQGDGATEQAEEEVARECPPLHQDLEHPHKAPEFAIRLVKRDTKTCIEKSQKGP